MEIEDIPDWVPDAARRLIITVQADNPFLRRFLTDPRMKGVWNVLNEIGPIEGGLRSADPEGMLSCIDYDVSERPSSTDYACAAFCWIVVKTTGDVYEGKPIARVEGQLNKLAKPYDEIVAGCIFLKKNNLFWNIPIPIEVSEAADKVASYAARMSDFIKQSEKPFILKRSSRERGDDDAVRAWTVRIAHGMITIWGKLFYSNLATIAEVLFELEHDPERRDAVKKWCQDLREKQA